MYIGLQTLFYNRLVEFIGMNHHTIGFGYEIQLSIFDTQFHSLPDGAKFENLTTHANNLDQDEAPCGASFEIQIVCNTDHTVPSKSFRTE